MHSIRRIAVLLGTALALAGCATSGEKFSSGAPAAGTSAVRQLPTENGRIYFYRTMLLGAAIQPVVTVNGEIVGRATPNGFFYVDRKPGSYDITVTTEAESKLTVNVEKGRSQYVKLNLSMGFIVGRITPELMDPAVATKEMADTRYTGE